MSIKPLLHSNSIDSKLHVSLKKNTIKKKKIVSSWIKVSKVKNGIVLYTPDLGIKLDERIFFQMNKTRKFLYLYNEEKSLASSRTIYCHNLSKPCKSCSKMLLGFGANMQKYSENFDGIFLKDKCNLNIE